MWRHNTEDLKPLTLHASWWSVWMSLSCSERVSFPGNWDSVLPTHLWFTHDSCFTRVSLEITVVTSSKAEHALRKRADILTGCCPSFRARAALHSPFRRNIASRIGYWKSSVHTGSARREPIGSEIARAVKRKREKKKVHGLLVHLWNIIPYCPYY